jgi:hypothetical protein
LVLPKEISRKVGGSVVPIVNGHAGIWMHTPNAYVRKVAYRKLLQGRKSSLPPFNTSVQVVQIVRTEAVQSSARAMEERRVGGLGDDVEDRGEDGYDEEAWPVFSRDILGDSLVAASGDGA